MLRSPSSSHSSLAEAPKASSVPDISQLQDDGKIIKTRKRKQPEPESEMAGTLKTFMESMSVSMEAMNKSINEVIKVELKNLSATTSDIKNELNLLRSENAEIKNKLAAMDAKQCETSSVLSDMQNSLEFTSDRVDKLHKRVDSARATSNMNNTYSLTYPNCSKNLKVCSSSSRKTSSGTECLTWRYQDYRNIKLRTSKTFSSMWPNTPTYLSPCPTSST
ncbi:unnamed protein product [Plutella xylostella]|uniref:(diamondback moth) hypothetical protein n=1 Tax=Plutella xylostella TaxID=51655 RepID=A0A8S4GF28_PLUXY|nr:unnamed protein product [Plutella xylostella]